MKARLKSLGQIQLLQLIQLIQPKTRYSPPALFCTMSPAAKCSRRQKIKVELEARQLKLDSSSRGGWPVMTSGSSADMVSRSVADTRTKLQLKALCCVSITVDVC